MIRCFIAIECNNPEVIEGIRRVQMALDASGARLKHVEAENIHLTLKFLGEVEQERVHMVAQVVESINFKPFSFMVEEVGAFPSLRRPATIWAGVTEGVSDLVAVFETVDDKLSDLGFEVERRRFHPHLTISRVRGGRNRKQLIDTLMQVKDTVFGSVDVDRIVLKKSTLTPRGPIYTTLAESKHS